MHVPLCVFMFLPIVHRGPCTLHAFGALRFRFLLYLNRSLSYSNRELPVSLSPITSYECTIIILFLSLGKHFGLFLTFEDIF